MYFSMKKNILLFSRNASPFSPSKSSKLLCLCASLFIILTYIFFLITWLIIQHLDQDARTTLWVEEWNALGDRSTEWRDRGIIPNEQLAGGTDEPWSTWRSLNRLRVQKGRCRAMMKMWKLSHYRCM